MRSPILAKHFIYGRDNETEFASRSPEHRKIMEFYEIWLSMSCDAVAKCHVDGLSIAQIFHFVHSEPADAPPDPLFGDLSMIMMEDDTDNSDGENLNELSPIMILDRALNLPTGSKKVGRRPKLRNEDGSSLERPDEGHA